jgi:hypothetical protein
MKFVMVIALSALLCGCDSEKDQFNQKMLHGYEVKCEQYYSVYDSSDIESAKKALHDVIDLSLAERSKAKYYWRFNLIIAGSDARLAVIAEIQGNKKEADQFFASASDYMVLQNKAFNQEMQRTSNVQSVKTETETVERMTPDQWRKWVAALDKQHNIKWKPSNN